MSRSPTSANNYTQHYKKWHSNDAQHIDVMRAFYLSALKNRFPENKSAKILDIGCGMGFFLETLKHEGYENIFGVDIDAGQIQAARSIGLNVEHNPNTVDFLNSRKKSYDFIYAIDVIEHISHDEQIEFIKTIYESLKSGGTFVCTVPNGNSVLAGRWRYIDWTHKTAFTEHSLEFLLNAGGFSNVTVSEVKLYKKYKKRPSFGKLFAENLVQKLMRSWRRLEIISELGFDEAMRIPLSVNILAHASRRDELT